MKNNWNEQELLQAKHWLESGKTYEEIGALLNRTWSSIRNKLYKAYGIKRTDFYNAYIIKNCAQCGSEFTVTKGSDRRYDHRFCSHSCSATYNSAKRGPMSEETKRKISLTLGGPGILQEKQTLCLYCNTELSKTATKFCGTQCASKYRKKIQIEQWLLGKISGTVKGGSLNLLQSIREWVFERAKHECEECECNKVNPYTGKSILQIDHTDGDASNTRPENLKVLCPTCHAMTPTYGNNGSRISKRRHWRKLTRSI